MRIATEDIARNMQVLAEEYGERFTSLPKGVRVDHACDLEEYARDRGRLPWDPFVIDDWAHTRTTARALIWG